MASPKPVTKLTRKLVKLRCFEPTDRAAAPDNLESRQPIRLTAGLCVY